MDGSARPSDHVSASRTVRVLHQIKSSGHFRATFFFVCICTVFTACQPPASWPMTDAPQCGSLSNLGVSRLHDVGVPHFCAPEEHQYGASGADRAIDRLLVFLVWRGSPRCDVACFTFQRCHDSGRQLLGFCDRCRVHDILTSRSAHYLVSTYHYPAGHRAVDDHARRFLYRSYEGPHRRRRPWYKIVWVTVRQEHIAAKMFPYSTSLMRLVRWTRLSLRCLDVSPIELGSCPPLLTFASRTVVFKRAAGASRAASD